MSARWIEALDPSSVDRRFGAEAVTSALSAMRVYAAPPSVDAASRLAATVVPVSVGARGDRLSTPLKVVVRIRSDDVLDFACACRSARVCEHAIGLLVDIAFAPALRALLASEAKVDVEPLALELPRLRAQAIEDRTLDDRLEAWLPTRAFDVDYELDVDARLVGDGQAGLLLRHRRRGNVRLVPAKDVLGARLEPRHRRLVDLMAAYVADKNVLVATRGQASLLVHLLREEIGVFVNGFKGRLRYATSLVRPRVEREDDRLVPRWYAGDGSLLGNAGDMLLFAGPFPWVWSPFTSTFHPVAPNVDLDAALGMQRVPSLPLDAGERVGRAVLVRGRGLGVVLPSPEELGLPPLERPSFELRLAGTPLDVTGELTAVYAAGAFRLDGADLADTGRDRIAEEEAIAQVRAAGLASEPDALVAREDDAIVLWQTGLPALRSSESPRFHVLAAASIATTHIGPPVTVDVRVRESAGWLETELEFRAGALRIEITRMHAALARSKRWVTLEDGTLARIADDVAALLGDRAVTDVSIKLPPHQLGRVARWIELADAHVSIHVDDRVSDLRARLHELAVRPRARLPSELHAELRPYQLTGLAWLGLLREIGAGGLLADDMGLGKTLMTLAFLARWKEDDGPAPVLVVCPTSLIGNWLRESARFTPGLRVCAWTGAERQVISGVAGVHDVIVTTYGVLRRDVEKLLKTRFRCVVLDEAQNVKNPASDTARAARKLDAELRLALTGTPVENRLSELWSLMTFANPGMLGTARDFEERYAAPIASRTDGRVADELRAVVRPFILRRTKSEVLVDLPPKTEIERACVFGLRQKRLYDALSVSVRQAVGTRERRRKDARTQLSVLTAILRLRQMACDPRLVDPEVPASESAKRAAFLDLVRELVSEDRRALVFSQFVELLTLWREDLDRANVAYEYLDGSTRDRDAVVERFQNGTAPLFLVSLKAGGAGLNLTAADTVIHCDPWWNPAAEDQATDRAHRIGQTRPVTVVRLVAQGTIEDKIELLKQTKQELADAIIGGDLGGLDDDAVDILLGGSLGEIDDPDAPDA